jgi:coenzyme F420-dependent glucose-6-phosphate dehydrogenase
VGGAKIGLESRRLLPGSCTKSSDQSTNYKAIIKAKANLLVSIMSRRIDFGYFAAHEQHDPAQLLRHVMLAEKHGFADIWTSDHFHPWAHTNASSGQAWAWMGAAAVSTKFIRIGTAVTSPGYRYHPALIAQTFATLDFMFPGRIFLTLGTGEAMNECPLGFPWPDASARRKRLEESIQIIRALWGEDFVTYKGEYFRTHIANLYTKPKTRIPIYIAANGPMSAYVAGKYADGILTTPAPTAYYKEKLFPAFERGATDAGRDPSNLERIVEILVSYDEDYDRALNSCRFWAGGSIPIFFQYAIYDPRVIESVGNKISLDHISKWAMITTSAEEGIKRTKEFIDAGFTHAQYLSSSPNESNFIRVFGDQVIPVLRQESFRRTT